jgi:hypothetical protein
MKSERRWKERWEEHDRARAALDAIDPDNIDDESLRFLIADELTAGRGPRYILSIIHDVRPSALRKLERIRKRLPGYEGNPANPTGPCPIEYDWDHKNVVGIITLDRDRAIQWAIEAMRFGYTVFQQNTKRGCGGSPGGPDHVRKRVRELRTTVRFRTVET